MPAGLKTVTLDLAVSMGDAAEWARICGEFQEIQRYASRFGLRARLERLVAGTRAGEETLPGWRALLADLERLGVAEESSASRGGDPWRRWTASPEPVGHVCPNGLCDRLAVEVLGRAPSCDLYAVVMRPGG